MSRIKVLIYLALFSMFLGTLFLAVGDTSAETHTQDKACFNTNPSTFQILQRNGDDYYQPFTPSQNRLDQVVVKIASNPNGDGGSGTATMQVRDSEEVLAQRSLPYTNLKSSSPQYFYFNHWNQGDVIEITAGHTYNIRLTTDQTDSQNWLYWYTTTICSNNGNFAYREGVQTGYYMDFSTWGWSVLEDSGDDSPGDSTPDQSSTTSEVTTVETLGEEDATIAKPSRLWGEYVELDNKRGINLTWEASGSTDIDGYKVFKSEERDKNYLKIVQVDSNKLEYLDEDVKASTTYYYIVRAYQDASQSASSNVAEVITPEDVGPNKPQSLRILDVGTDYIEVAWTKNKEEDIAGYVLMIINNDDLVESVELTKEENKYIFENLREAEVYTITLVAKNESGKFSPSSSLVQRTNALESSSYILTTAVILLGLGGVGLILLLILLILRRKRQQQIRH